MKIPLPGTITDGSVSTSSEPRKKLITNVTAAARRMLPLAYAWAADASGPDDALEGVANTREQDRLHIGKVKKPGPSPRSRARNRPDARPRRTGAAGPSPEGRGPPTWSCLGRRGLCHFIELVIDRRNERPMCPCRQPAKEPDDRARATQEEGRQAAQVKVAGLPARAVPSASPACTWAPAGSSRVSQGAPVVKLLRRSVARASPHEPTDRRPGTRLSLCRTAGSSNRAARGRTRGLSTPTTSSSRSPAVNRSL